MITIWKTGEVEYPDVRDIDKPVRYTIESLLEVASRTSRINVTDEHKKDVIGEMSNFIVEDGLLKAEEPNGLELSGMGFSPVFNYDLVDMGDYYIPKNIRLTEIGYTKTPRSHIVYNSISAPNSEVSIMDDSEIQKLVKRNNQLQEEIGVLKNNVKQLKKSIQDKEDDMKKIKDSYASSDEKIKEYDRLKEIETNYNKLISSKRDDLIHQIVGEDKKLAEELKDYTIQNLETTLKLMKGNQGGKGVYSKGNHIDDGNDAEMEKDEEEEYTDEMFEEDFKNSGL